MDTRELMRWEELYVAAVLEPDPTKIAERINVAQDALRERWQALGQVPLARNPDGTIPGASLRNPFDTGTGGVPTPRTEAEERRARAKVAADIAAEDVRDA